MKKNSKTNASGNPKQTVSHQAKFRGTKNPDRPKQTIRQLSIGPGKMRHLPRMTKKRETTDHRHHHEPQQRPHYCYLQYSFSCLTCSEPSTHQVINDWDREGTTSYYVLFLLLLLLLMLWKHHDVQQHSLYCPFSTHDRRYWKQQQQ
jgi:hypothetical protein